MPDLITTRYFQLALVAVIGLVVALMAWKAFNGDPGKTDAPAPQPATQYMPREGDAPSAVSGAASEVESEKPFRVLKQGQTVGEEGK